MLRHLLKTLKEKGRRKLEILIDALLGDDDEDEDRESRSIKDYWEKVKDYFRDLKIDLQEKYMKFGEWVKDVMSKGLENSKDKMENIKAIAKEVTLIDLLKIVLYKIRQQVISRFPETMSFLR